jgi:hypothetical protein
MEASTGMSAHGSVATLVAQGGLLGSAQANTSCAGELRTVCSPPLSR